MKLFRTEGAQKLLGVFQRYKYLLLIVAVGLVFILWPDGEKAAPPPAADQYPVFSVSDTEKRLEQALSKIEGAGRVEVVLTLKSDMEIILQQDSKVRQYREMEDGALTVSENESEFETVFSGGSSGEPVITKRVYPQYRGALIVCEGGRSPAVQTAVLDAVSGLTGLKTGEITIAIMKK